MSEERKIRLSPEDQALKERLMRSGELVVRKGKGRISDDFFDMPKLRDPEGLLLKALLEDREQGR